MNANPQSAGAQNDGLFPETDPHRQPGVFERNDIRPFQFEGRNIRLIDQNGETWFVATDVARELGYAEAKDLTRILDDDEKGRHNLPTLGGDQEVTLISEPGLYRAIIQRRANKKHDHALTERISRFQRWVFHDILPSIRKTGGYGARDPMAVLNDPAAMRGLLLTYSEKVLALQQKVGAMTETVAAHQRLVEAEGSLCVTDAAKSLGVPPNRLFRWLDTNDWTYTRPGTTGRLAYQSKIAAGLMEHKVTTKTRADGSEAAFTQARITPKGLSTIAKKMAPAFQDGRAA